MPIWTITNYLPQVMLRTSSSLVLFSFVLVSFFTQAKDPQPTSSLAGYKATYKAFRSNMELGSASQELTKTDNGHYLFHYRSNVSLLFLKDIREEKSYFSFDNGIPTPIRYSYKRTGTGKDKHTTVFFDKKQALIEINNEETFPWQGELDNLLYFIDIKQKLAMGKEDVNYQFINNRGDIRDYKIKVIDSETLKLPYGQLETVKVKVIRKSKKRESYIWFAPSLDYLMVRFRQFKKGKEQADIQLSHYQPNNHVIN